MLIVDSHLDLSMNGLQWNRDLFSSVNTIRAQEAYTPGKGRGQGTVAFPEMRRGRIALSFATLIARSTGHPRPHIDFPTAVQAYGTAKGQLAYYRALERAGHVRLIESIDQLTAHMDEWRAWDAETPANAAQPKPAAGGAPNGEGGGQGPSDDWRSTPPLGFVLSMEGADPILEPSQLAEWWEGGLRLLGLTHYGPGRYAGGTGTEIGLTDLGLAILPEMERLGIILDVTHCSDDAFWQALSRYGGPVHASHNNCRAIAPHQRQFSDEQIRAIVARNGVIGVALDCWMIKAGWRHGDDNSGITLADVVAHIDHICQLTGSAGHVAIGTDLDGGFGREGSPADLDTIADLQKIPALLRHRGYGEPDVAAIMNGNWTRFLSEAWRDGGRR